MRIMPGLTLLPVLRTSDCLKRLVKLSRRDTVSRHFPSTNDADSRSAVGIAESTFELITGAASDLLDLGYRTLWVLAMRHYKVMPTEAKKRGKICSDEIDRGPVEDPSAPEPEPAPEPITLVGPRDNLFYINKSLLAQFSEVFAVEVTVVMEES